MREAVFILVIVLVVAGLTAIRYRKQIQFALEMWRMLGSARRTTKDRGGEIGETVDSTSLVKCGRCGVWVPESRSVTNNSKNTFCSAECASAVIATG